MLNFSKSNKAFTLLEVMVSFFIFSILLTVIFLSFKTNFKIMQSSIDKKERLNNTSHLTNYIKREAEKATEISTNIELFEGYQNSLGFVLQMKPYSDNKNLKYEYVWYVKSGKSIKRYTFFSDNDFDKINLDKKKIESSNKNKIEIDIDDLECITDKENGYMMITQKDKKEIIDIKDKLR